MRVFRSMFRPGKRRRATILLMVVSLLALLFIIVTGFLSLSRVNQAVVVSTQKADLTDAIGQAMDDWAISLIKKQIVDGNGGILAGGAADSYSYEDIPGYRASNFLASLEPVWDPSAAPPAGLGGGSWPVLAQLRWPAVSSLDDGVRTPTPFSLYQLMRDYTYADYGSGNFTQVDVQWNARNPFMDADGDGVPDSYFLLSAPATAAANGMAGVSVSTPAFDPADPYGLGGAFASWNLPPLNAANGWLSDEKWAQYDQQARYEVAMRIISHGGMVTLDSPTLYMQNGNPVTPFNRDFVIDLFDATRMGNPTRNQWAERALRWQYSNVNDQNRLFDALHASMGAVEPALRHRFILATPADSAGRGAASRSVPVLAELLGETSEHAGFPSTLVPAFVQPASRGARDGQRINVGDAEPSSQKNERQGWANAVALDATEYNQNGGGGNVYGQVEAPYARRSFITTVNNSDELARKQESGEPKQMGAGYGRDFGEPADSHTGRPQRGATLQGELKFYLGEVTKAFDRNTPGPDQFQYNSTRGRVIIDRLARLYYDMLASHSRQDLADTTGDDWDNATSTTPPDPTKSLEAPSRRQQAFMLAVNTVSFASPRDLETSATPGWIDPVAYTDDNGTPSNPNDDVIYSGYAPQPFISEVIAFKEQLQDESAGEQQVPGGGGGGGGGGNTHGAPKIAIAVEIYNPNDRYDPTDTGTGKDVFGLYLPQFGVSVDETEGSPMAVQPLTGCGEPTDTNYLYGRSFSSFVLKPESSSSVLDSQTRGSVSIMDGSGSALALNLQSGDADPKFTIKLWRLAHNGTSAYVVETIQVGVPVDDDAPEARYWTSVYRDTSVQRYYDPTDGLKKPLFGGDVALQEVPPEMPPARWGVATSLTQSGSGHNSPLDGVTPLNNAAALKAPNVLFDPDGSPGTPPFGPSTPLITMNAGLYGLPMFGNTADLRPASFPTVGFMLFIPRFSHMHAVARTSDPWIPMAQTLRRQWDNQSYTLAKCPADFGHMPIFDNRQNVVSGTYLKTGGRIPWGLLVFDYFTTVNPQRDDDQNKVPDVDPLCIAGRININTAPWYVLANLPLLGPVPNTTTGNLNLPVYPPNASTVTLDFPSPAFWDPAVGVLVGWGGYDSYTNLYTLPRLVLGGYQPGADLPYADTRASTAGRYRLGPWLAQAAAAYRDGVQYVSSNTGNPFYPFWDSFERNGLSMFKYRPDASYTQTHLPDYGSVRGSSPGTGQPPTQFGFLSVGELLNVKGFDSTTDVNLWTAWTDRPGLVPPIICANTSLANGDFVKAVSLLALLDSQYLTTRSNTFTVYASVMDRQEPQRSVRLQTTVDRSNLLPQLTYAFYDPSVGLAGEYYSFADALAQGKDYLPYVPVLLDLSGASPGGPDNVRETPVRTVDANAEPQVIASEQVSYYNTKFDD